MKIIHTGDWHLGKTLDGFSRMEEQEQFLDFFIQTCQDRQPDLIVIAGDIFDTSNPSAPAETMFYDCLKKLSDLSNALIVIIPGNHDSPKRLSSARPLAKSHGIILYENHDDPIPLGKYKNATVLSCKDGVIKVDINSHTINILALPYISESRLNESIQDLFESDEKNAKSFQEKFQSLIEKKSAHFREDEYNIMIAHLFALKAKISEEEAGYSIGGAYIVDSSIFPQNADYIALGHIHKMQAVAGVNKRAYYSGSPIHYNKTETKVKEKVLLEVNIDQDKNLQVTPLPIPIFKKIEVWQTDSIESAIELCKEKSQENSFVYLQIQTDRIISNEELRTIHSLKKDIIEIRPIFFKQEILTSTENMIEKSEIEKFIEFYKYRHGLEPREAIIERYLTIINHSK